METTPHSSSVFTVLKRWRTAFAYAIDDAFGCNECPEAIPEDAKYTDVKSFI
jgi:hypothetical protein